MPHSSRCRRNGSRPRIQKLPPFQAEHREDEPAGVDAQQQARRGQVEQTNTVLVGPIDIRNEQAANVGHVQGHQTREDQNLGPLGGIAAEGAEVLDNQQTRL